MSSLVERAEALERALYLSRGYELDACDVLDIAEYLRAGTRGLPVVTHFVDAAQQDAEAE